VTRYASAGVALVRVESGTVEVLLGHLGGPFWAKKTDGAWSFPKGLVDEGESAIAAAWREFHEETGLTIGQPDSAGHDLGTVSTSTKTIQLFAFLSETKVDLDEFVPGLFELEWPPRSGRLQSFPEIDRLAWTTLDDARTMLSAGQRPFVDRIETWLADLS
jgi:predicted NUDIX family NTP pyrophosphohydrolase